MKKKQYKIYLLEARYSSIAVFDRRDKMTAYKNALKRAEPELEIFDTHSYTDLKPIASNFNVPLNPVFKDDVHLKSKKTQASAVKIEAPKKPKIDKTAKNKVNDTIDELVGITIKKPNFS
jgi:hypothetical protein